jgi:hypothetical protein
VYDPVAPGLVIIENYTGHRQNGYGKEVAGVDHLAGKLELKECLRVLDAHLSYELPAV